MKHIKNDRGDIVTTENFSDFIASVKLPVLGVVPHIEADDSMPSLRDIFMRDGSLEIGKKTDE